MTTDIVSALISVSLFTQQSVGWHEFRLPGTESGEEVADLERLIQASFLSILWPKRTDRQRLSQESNHRLTAAITDLITNQSTQTLTHKQANMCTVVCVLH